MKKEIKERINAVRDKNIPVGYMETEAGVLPQDWKIATLGDIADEIVERAGTQSYETLSISAGIGFVNQAQKFGKELSGKQYEKYTVLHNGDFSYNKGNSSKCPQGCIYRLNDRNVAAVPNVFESFRIKCGCEEYYEQLFSNGFLNRQLTRKINHGVRDDGLLNLTGKDFYSCFVPVPPIKEQEKIAKILFSCDESIRHKAKRLKEKKNHKKWLMQVLLQKKEYWQEKKLSDLASIETGNADTKDRKENGEYPFFVRSANVEKIDTFSYDGEAILTPGDGNIGEIFHYIVGKFDFHQRVYKISDFSDICCGKYIYYYLQQFFKRRAMSMTAKATVDSLRRDMLTDMNISLPSIEIQKNIAEILSVADEQIAMCELELFYEKQKKKALSQLLLKGMVRV